MSANKEQANTRALKRAAGIPNDVISKIQNIVIDEIDLDSNGLDAVSLEDGQNCPNDEHSLILTGQVSDYKKGNRAVRYLVGFGAGKQKIATNLTLAEKISGKIIAQDEIIDRKIGGLVGGSEDKGKRDYAEKVNNFIRYAIGMKKTPKR